MADDITLNAGSGGATLATDEISSAHYQKIVIGYGADGTWTRVTASAGFPVKLETGHADIAVTLDGEAVVLAANDGTDIGDVTVNNAAGSGVYVQPGIGATFTVDCNSSNVTVDGVPAPLNVTGGGTEASALRVTVASDSTGVISVDDNDGSLSIDDGGNTITVDGTVAATQSGNWSVRAQDGSGSAITSTTVGADQALDVNLVQSISLNITNISGTVSLPTGAATESTLDTAKDYLVSIDGDTGNILTDTSTIREGYGLEGDTLGKGVLVQADDGSNRHNLQTDASGYLKTVAQASTNTQEVVGDAAEDAAAAGNPVLSGGRYDATERTLDDGDAGALALSAQGWAMVGSQSGYLFDGATRCQVKRATGLAASGTATMIAAVAAKKIRVLALALFSTSATVTNIYIHNDDNDLLGDSSNPLPLAQDADGDNVAGFVLPWNPGGWCETDTANEPLSVTLSAAEDVIYAVTYIEVD